MPGISAGQFFWSSILTTLGFDLAKDEIRWCALSGTRGAPKYVEHGIETYTVGDYRGELLNKSAAIFLPIVKRFAPIAVAYRISLDASSADQIAYLHLPYAILISQCQELGITPKEFNLRSFTAKLLGFAKNLKRDDGCDAVLGVHPPHWAKARAAAMAAWGALDV